LVFRAASKQVAKGRSSAQGTQLSCWPIARTSTK